MTVLVHLARALVAAPERAKAYVDVYKKLPGMQEVMPALGFFEAVSTAPTLELQKKLALQHADDSAASQMAFQIYRGVLAAYLAAEHQRSLAQEPVGAGAAAEG